MSICLTECCKCVIATGVCVSVMASPHPAPSDYQPGPYSVMFLAGSTTAAVNITIIDDDDEYEGSDPEAFTATISTANTGVPSISPGDNNTATISINENEGVQTLQPHVTCSVHVLYNM